MKQARPDFLGSRAFVCNFQLVRSRALSGCGYASGRAPERGLPSAAAAPAPAPCFRRRRRSPAQQCPHGSPGLCPHPGLDIKKSTCFLRSRCLVRIFQVLPARGISRALKTFRRNVFACAAMPRNSAQAGCKNQRAALVPKLAGRAQRPIKGCCRTNPP